MKKKIPTGLHDAIQEQSARGLGCAEIVIWLDEHHSIKSSTPSVSRLLKILKNERKEIAQRIYADAVSKSANNDLDILNDVIVKCKARFDILIESGADFKAKGIGEVLFKYLSKRMDISGLNEKDNNDDLVKEELLKKLAGI